ncbi:MAG: acyltransferase family protein [Clostridia bacterium]|nr:acyltransferase family protein [Clostridia bacterium]
MKERINYMDGLKFFAAMWIFITHFITTHAPSGLLLWRDFPYTLIFKGITGKLCVSLLGVILGYLSYIKGTKTEKLGPVIIKRYVHFVVMAVVINIFGALKKGYNFAELKTYFIIAVNSLMLNHELAAIFWCIQSFFLASVILYILGKYKVSSFPIILLTIVFFVCDNVWISVCLMGAVLYRITNYEISSAREKFLSRPWVQIALFVIAFFAIKRSESSLTFYIQGVCCVFILIIFSVNKTLKKIFSCKVFAYLGKQSMGIFLLHSFVYPIITKYIYSNFPDIPLVSLVAFLVSAIITIGLSIVVVFIIDKISAFANWLIFYIWDFCVKAVRRLIPSKSQ